MKSLAHARNKRVSELDPAQICDKPWPVVYDAPIPTIDGAERLNSLRKTRPAVEPSITSLFIDIGPHIQPWTFDQRLRIDAVTVSECVISYDQNLPIDDPDFADYLWASLSPLRATDGPVHMDDDNVQFVLSRMSGSDQRFELRLPVRFGCDPTVQVDTLQLCLWERSSTGDKRTVSPRNLCGFLQVSIESKNRPRITRSLPGAKSL